MARIPEVCDSFNARPQPKHFSSARPMERQKLLRYIRNYLRECERQEMALPSRRRRVND